MFQAKKHAAIDPQSDSFKGYPLVVFYRDGKIIENMKPGSIEDIITFSKNLNSQNDKKLQNDLESINNRNSVANPSN